MSRKRKIFLKLFFSDIMCVFHLRLNNTEDTRLRTTTKKKESALGMLGKEEKRKIRNSI